MFPVLAVTTPPFVLMELFVFDASSDISYLTLRIRATRVCLSSTAGCDLGQSAYIPATRRVGLCVRALEPTAGYLMSHRGKRTRVHGRKVKPIYYYE